MTGKKQPGQRYRYTLEPEGEQPEPLEECPSCTWSLTDLGGVAVELVDHEHTWEVSSRLDSNGVLEDVSGNVAAGLHSATMCGDCGKQLIDIDDVVETDIGAAKAGDEETPLMPRCCPKCGGADLACNLIDWFAHSLAADDVLNACILQEHQCRDCGTAFYT